MQELAKQNQELMTLLRSRGEIPSPGQDQNAEEIPRNETGRNQNQNQNDEGSSANQNREPLSKSGGGSHQIRSRRQGCQARGRTERDEGANERDEEPGQEQRQPKTSICSSIALSLPFTKRIDEYPLPAKFKVPQLETFDGFKDPLDYLDSFRTIMRLHGVSDEIMCRTFPTNLRGSARTWFNQLETGSIDTFAQSYVQRFNKEAVQIDEPNEYVALTAFNAGLLKGDFLFQLCKDPPKSMSELMYEAQKFINAEDAFEARDEFLSRKRKEPRRIDDSIRPGTSLPSKTIQRLRGRTQARPTDTSRWPGKLHSDPEKRSKNLYCRFHRDHGHTTEDCFALKQQIETLIRQGKLGKFVRQDKPEVHPESRPSRQDENKDRQEDCPRDIIGEIRTIIGGLASEGASRSSRKAYARQAHNILVTQRSRKSLKMDDQVISFSEDDARNIHHPHDDALVMKIDKEQLKPIDIPLVGFTGDKVQALGSSFPHYRSRDIPETVTSTYHLLVRFPTEHGIGELKGDQATARECYFASLGPEAKHQTMKIDEGHKARRTHRRVGGDSVGRRRAKQNHQHWDKNGRNNKGSHDQFPKKNQAISDEVEKLLKAGFIREVFYPDWLANVVMVKKANGKWRMCVDFTDLNKACPKDSFPLPRIDQLVDSTAGHRLLTFMDAFSGYNQIMMDDADQEKTSFITSKGLFCYKVMPFGIEERWGHLPVTNEQDVPPPDRTKRRGTDECQKSFEELKRYLTSPPLLSPSQQGEALSLYLAVSPTAVSSALIREDGGTQLLVYYTSKAFQGAEERYSAMEKLALALVIAARKLRPYFQSHKIIILTNHPLHKAMNKPDAAGRLIQWAVELSEFDIEYHPRQAIKAQALADFIAEFTVTEDEPSEEKPGRRVNGEYKAREDRMTKYLKLVRNAMKWFDEVILVQVPREQNTEADALAKLASSDEATDQHIEVQHSPSHLEEEVSAIDVSNSWMTPIVNYLEDETLPSDPVEARKLKVRSTRFILIQGVLYKRGFSLPYLRCLDKAEANYVMREVHEGICGNHSGARSLVHKLVRAGYYWPTMQKDAVSYIRACDKCQRFGNLIHSPPETLTPMTAPWPFAQWDNGRQFDNSPFREFCEELGIHNHYSSPGHPQANGQVEVTNRSLLKMIKTRLEGAKGLWPEELPNILWAYRTTARTPTGETPFRLTYGIEAVIPVEIGLTTWRTNHYDEGSNDVQLRSNLDLVDEVRDQAEASFRVYQQRMARYYDRRVKYREFKVGDLVLRKVTLATKDLTQGKLGPTWEGPYKVVKFHRRGTYHLEKLDGDALPHPWNAEHLKKYYQ
uniref:Integrase catalytic domain-containing protein n=1 Tax=Fagus sylvatica TaxID=28930 RepID=A0A2N9FQA3_FAGSY